MGFGVNQQYTRGDKVRLRGQSNQYLGVVKIINSTVPGIYKVKSIDGNVLEFNISDMRPVTKKSYISFLQKVEIERKLELKKHKRVISLLKSVFKGKKYSIHGTRKEVVKKLKNTIENIDIERVFA